MKNNITTLAKEKYSAFLDLVRDVPYERKGILYSEMYFLWLSSQYLKPNRVLESGRARGQSTLILSKIFPNSEIISVEHDKNSSDVEVAEARLAHSPNVTLLYGDATIILQELASSSTNDIALIDGPKGFRGVRFAFNLLKNKGVKQCYLHDTTWDTEERVFLDKHLDPNSIEYSDAPNLAEITHELDIFAKMEVPERFKYCPRKPYGFSLGCLTNNPKTNYQNLILLSRFHQLINRIKRKIS